MPSFSVVIRDGNYCTVPSRRIDQDLASEQSFFMSRVEAGTLYGELPLSLSSHSLRLWKFCTSSSDEVLEVQLVTFDPGTHPKYKALSYEWYASTVAMI